MTTRLHLVVPEWQERGLCQQVDPELFYPERGENAEAAKAICRRCEVQPDCLKWSLDNREPFGVWGGVSEPERRKLIRAGLDDVQLGYVAEWMASHRKQVAA